MRVYWYGGPDWAAPSWLVSRESRLPVSVESDGDDGDHAAIDRAINRRLDIFVAAREPKRLGR